MRVRERRKKKGVSKAAKRVGKRVERHNERE
jgi:hypothetical protein